MFKVGKIQIDGVTALAPMAGIGNAAFREICREHGAALVYCEMVDENGVARMNPRTIAMTRVSPKEHPVALQIVGCDLESFKRAAIYCDLHSDCDIIDINMGCPVPKVAVNRQAGAALLKDLDRIFTIVDTVVRSVSKPVSVKIRTGWDDKSINCVEVARTIERAGASLIAVHGRTRDQGYSGKADLDLIKAVKQAVKIPVLGNGDIFSAADALRMIEYTGVDGVMIARGAQGNPWIFKAVEQAFLDKTVNDARPGAAEVLEVMLDHASRLVALKGERAAMLEMRGHCAHYLKTAGATKQARIDFCMLATVNDLRTAVARHFPDLVAGMPPFLPAVA